MEELDVNQMSPLVWAYIGDSVYEQYIRDYLVSYYISLSCKNSKKI